MRMFQQLRHGDRTQVQRHARDSLELMGESGMALYLWRHPNALKLLGDIDIDTGRYAEARARYAKYFPELLTSGNLELTPANFYAAVDIAAVLQRTGEHERANWLLGAVLDYKAHHPRLGIMGYWIDDVRAYALRGEQQAALNALRQAVDAGWRDFWWYYLKYDPVLKSLHNEANFQAIVDEIKADMATQLAHVKQMEDHESQCKI